MGRRAGGLRRRFRLGVWGKGGRGRGKGGGRYLRQFCIVNGSWMYCLREFTGPTGVDTLSPVSGLISNDQLTSIRYYSHPLIASDS